jgi:hypothetical protein
MEPIVLAKKFLPFLQVLEQCGCVPFFHTMAYEDYPRICSGTSLLCMNTILVTKENF